MNIDFFKEFQGAVTICDETAIILYMNEKAIRTFESYGGAALIGKSLFDCHGEASRQKLMELLLEKKTNVYTIEKNGVKKMIYQAPWYEEGNCMGLVELSLELPAEMPHFVRS